MEEKGDRGDPESGESQVMGPERSGDPQTATWNMQRVNSNGTVACTVSFYFRKCKKEISIITLCYGYYNYLYPKYSPCCLIYTVASQMLRQWYIIKSTSFMLHHAEASCALMKVPTLQHDRYQESNGISIFSAITSIFMHVRHTCTNRNISE